MLPNNVEVLCDNNNLLTHAMAKLDEKNVQHLFRQGLEKGLDPCALLDEVKAGVQKVAELYNRGQYFLGDVIMAGEIFQDITNMILKLNKIPLSAGLPPIIFGTVEEDIHDIGKNITISILRSKGLVVDDLGVDVPADIFVDAARSTGAAVVCLSGLITPSYDSMKKTIDLLKKAGLRTRISVVIGGLVNEDVRKYTGADHWVKDCTSGTSLCDTILHAHHKKSALCL